MIVGLFVLAGIAAVAALAVQLGKVGGFGEGGYTLTATFSDAGGVREGSDVMLAGVVIGRVQKVELVDSDKARLVLQIHEGVRLTTDAVASIRTKGIIGERFVRISQGADEEYLQPGDEFDETESAINIEDLVSKYIFSGK
ncbi:MAG: outer membrane lipid asymmetry maintenance protein MlaD [Zetaproteobacteria bacterium]|nr:MAG: outer membrane lipid asymmetry maintenance protein MlaD [Zetaproteobacteria bacterium]